MAKKKGKKGKGKKDEKKKSGLSNHEREIFRSTVAELEHKIAWRNHMSSIIEEDLKQYQEKYDVERKDKIEAVHILEEAIDEQGQISESIQRALPDAENWKVQVEDKRGRELASKLMKKNEEKFSYEEKLDTLRKKLKSLETYDKVKVDQKIEDIKTQLESEDVEDALLKAEEQEKRRKNTFRQEMKDIIEHEAELFQVQLSGKSNENFKRITEETRWWADQTNNLRIASKHLERINDAKTVNLRASRKELIQRKKTAVQTSHRLQERDVAISELVHRNEGLEEMKMAQDQLMSQLQFLGDLSKSMKLNVDDEEKNLKKFVNQMEENENYIKSLEEKLLNEIQLGQELKQIIEKAQHILMEEANYSLIVTYNGPPKKKRTLEELRSLFAEATKFIYDRVNRSMLERNSE